MSQPADLQRHFYLHYYAMLSRVLLNLRYLAEQDDDRLQKLHTAYPFLDAYEQLLIEQAALPLNRQADWWAEQIAAIEQSAHGHFPLRSLGLPPDQLRMLLAVGMVEEHISFGALFAYLQEPLPARLPGLGILGVLLGQPGAPLPDSWQTCRPLIDSGLIYVQNPADPRAEWLLRVPPLIWDALRGRPLEKPVPGCILQAGESFPTLDQLILPDDIRRQVSQVPALLTSGQVSALVLRGMGGTGRRIVIGALANHTGQSVLLVESITDENRRLIGPLATLTHAMPVLRLNPNPGETVDVPSLAGYRGAVGITAGRSGGLRGEALLHALTLTLPPPDREARAQFWDASTVPIDPTEAETITRRFLVTGGIIHRAGGLATTYARLDQREQVNTADVQRALRALNRQTLDTLATPLSPADGWGELVVSQTVMDELRLLESRCRSREDLHDGAGPALRRSLNRGVRALFSGASGTGKTLAARTLTAALQMDLYRVDLAAVVNKYIGETERNLNEVLSRAEELDVVLLLDEGDALMAKRTDVSNANDRYANLETNYLLQRLEVYEGIVIITTNAAARIDSAFQRRIDVIIDFSKPDATEREQLWHLHLPADNRISPALLKEVATRCALTGGQIRNAALTVILLADANDLPANDAILEEALQRTYRKEGQAYPLRGTPTIDHSHRLRLN
jgi:hypothetical protein